MSSQIIGKGGFGTVSIVPGTDKVEKIMKLKCYENIKEISFLSSYKNIPFISKLYKLDFNIKNDYIKMTMLNAGKTLKDMKKNFTTAEKIELVPEMLIQMVRILLWMNQEQILHCDIKPANICMDSKFNITLIDWGFVQKMHNKNKYHIGTKIYYDPLAYNEIKINFRSEIFAFGFSLCYFLLSNIDFDEWEDFCIDFYDFDFKDRIKIKKLNEEAFNIIGLNKLEKEFNNIFKSSVYFNIIKSMLNFDPEYDIDLECIYETFSEELQMKYPLFYETRKEPIVDLKNLNVNFDDNISLFNNTIVLKFANNKCFSLLNAYQLFFKLLPLKLLEEYTSTQIMMLSWLISSILNNDDAINIDLCKISFKCSEDECYYLLIKMCLAINFDVYPESQNYEWNRVNEDIWREIFITEDDKFNLNMFSSELFELLYNDYKERIFS